MSQGAGAVCAAGQSADRCCSNIAHMVHIMLIFDQKAHKTVRKVNNDAREHELHSTHRGLWNNSTGHYVKCVLKVSK